MSVKLSLLAVIESVVYFMKMHVYKPADGYRFTVTNGRKNLQHLIHFQTHSSFPSLSITFTQIQKKNPSLFAYTVQVLSEVSFPLSLLLINFFILINICKTANTWLKWFLSTLLYESYTCNSNRLKVSLAHASITGSSVICDVQNLLYKLVFVAGFTPICAEQFPGVNS